jgi:hypothetical protein
MFGIFKKKEDTTVKAKITELVRKSEAVQSTHEMSVQTLHTAIEEAHAALDEAKTATQKVHAAIGIAVSHKFKAKDITEKTNKELD